MIDITKEHVTKGGLKIVGLEVNPDNATFPLRGFIMKPSKTSNRKKHIFHLWTADGISDPVWHHNPWMDISTNQEVDKNLTFQTITDLGWEVINESPTWDSLQVDDVLFEAGKDRWYGPFVVVSVARRRLIHRSFKNRGEKKDFCSFPLGAFVQVKNLFPNGGWVAPDVKGGAR